MHPESKVGDSGAFRTCFRGPPLPVPPVLRRWEDRGQTTLPGMAAARGRAALHGGSELLAVGPELNRRLGTSSPPKVPSLIPPEISGRFFLLWELAAGWRQPRSGEGVMSSFPAWEHG